MKKSNRKVLAIVGTYTDEGGKASFFGEQIVEVFKTNFGSQNVKSINGGTYGMLEEIINEVTEYQIIL